MNGKNINRLVPALLHAINNGAKGSDISFHSLDCFNPSQVNSIVNLYNAKALNSKGGYLSDDLVLLFGTLDSHLSGHTDEEITNYRDALSVKVLNLSNYISDNHPAVSCCKFLEHVIEDCQAFDGDLSDAIYALDNCHYPSMFHDPSMFHAYMKVASVSHDAFEDLKLLYEDVICKAEDTVTEQIFTSIASLDWNNESIKKVLHDMSHPTTRIINAEYVRDVLCELVQISKLPKYSKEFNEFMSKQIHHSGCYLSRTMRQFLTKAPENAEAYVAFLQRMGQNGLIKRDVAKSLCKSDKDGSISYDNVDLDKKDYFEGYKKIPANAAVSFYEFQSKLLAEKHSKEELLSYFSKTARLLENTRTESLKPHMYRSFEPDFVVDSLQSGELYKDISEAILKEFYNAALDESYTRIDYYYSIHPNHYDTIGSIMRKLYKQLEKYELDSKVFKSSCAIISQCCSIKDEGSETISKKLDSINSLLSDKRLGIDDVLELTRIIVSSKTTEAVNTVMNVVDYSAVYDAETRDERVIKNTLDILRNCGSIPKEKISFLRSIDKIMQKTTLDSEYVSRIVDIIMKAENQKAVSVCESLACNNELFEPEYLVYMCNVANNLGEIPYDTITNAITDKTAFNVAPDDNSSVTSWIGNLYDLLVYLQEIGKLTEENCPEVLKRIGLSDAIDYKYARVKVPLCIEDKPGKREKTFYKY